MYWLTSMQIVTYLSNVRFINQASTWQRITITIHSSLDQSSVYLSNEIEAG